MSKKRIGLYIDLWDQGVDGKEYGWKDVKGMAQIAEQNNFDTFSLPDRLHIWGHGQWESTTMLAAVAAVTSTIKLEIGVMRSIYRNPTLVGKIVDSIQEISGGRLILGLGAGSDVGENKEYGYPENYRYSRFEESLQILLSLLHTGKADFQGRFYQANNCMLTHRESKHPVPPLFIAAKGPKMLRLAARHADIWNIPIVPDSPDGWKTHLKDLEEACEEVGRDPATLEKHAIVAIPSPNKDIKHPGEGFDGTPLSRDARQAADQVEVFFEAGFKEILLWPAVCSAQAVEEMVPLVELLKS